MKRVLKQTPDRFRLTQALDATGIQCHRSCMFKKPLLSKQLAISSILISFALSHQACKDDPETTEPEPIVFVVPDHPYMLVTADRKDLILENIESETLGHIFTRIQSQALKELKTPEPGDWDAGLHGDNAEIAMFNAFIAWLQDDAEAAARSIAAMEMLETNWDDHTQWGINIRMPESLMHYTAAWDFLMATEFFSQEQSQAIEEKLTAITEQFYDYYVLDPFFRGLALEVAQNNHPIRTAACIGFIGLAFQDHPKAKEWLDWAVSELDYLMGPGGQYVQVDGSVSEGPHYFSFGFAPTVAFFIAVDNRQDPETLYNRNCINRSDLDPWTGHGCTDDEVFTYPSPIRSEFMHAVLDWSLSIRLPQGHRAPIADSPLRNQAAQALFVHYGAPQHHLWDWSSNPNDPYKIRGGHDLSISHLAYVQPSTNAEPPSWKNRFLPDGGMANFRSGWQTDDRVLMLMGESGAARKTLHDHVDGTSFVMGAYGELLVTDTGYYKPNERDNAVTANASSHNVILIDGKGAPAKGILNAWGGADAFIENTLETQNLAYAESRQTYEDTQIIRGVVFVRERYFVMADQLTSEDTANREYRYRTHAYAGYDLGGEVILQEHGPHIQRDTGALEIFTACTAGLCTVEEPSYTPLYLPHVHKLNSEAGDHKVTDSVTTANAPDFLTVLAPYQIGQTSGLHAPLTVTAIEVSHGAAWLIENAGHRDVAWTRETGAPETLELPTGETISTDAYFSLASLDNELAILSRGNYIKINNLEIISATDSPQANIKVLP